MKKLAGYKLMLPAHACVQAPSTNVGSAAIAAVHAGCPNFQFHPNGSHPEYIVS